MRTRQQISDEVFARVNLMFRAQHGYLPRSTKEACSAIPWDRSLQIAYELGIEDAAENFLKAQKKAPA